MFQAPPKSLVDKYLDAIAKTYDVPFEAEPDAVEVGEEFHGGGGGGGGGGLIDFSEPTAAAQQPDKKKESFMYPPPAMNVCTWAVHISLPLLQPLCRITVLPFQTCTGKRACVCVRA